MGRIAQLSELVANQIAAGEVVERPASVIRELLDNAIDAGATKIDVIVSGGGLTRMEVQDNGCGMDEDDLVLSIIRHATSKLRTMDDFRKLHTLGFRGEALPSIASVSHMILRSRVEGHPGGIELRVTGGEKIDQAPIGMARGTRVTVEDLFYNTPARLKFVRSLQTEVSHITEVVTKRAMAYPAIAFTLKVDGKLTFLTPGSGDLTSVFLSLYGADVTKRALAVHGVRPDLRVHGLIGAPQDARTARHAMWFYVNQRPIRSQALQYAVIEGYGTALFKGRYPLTALFLEMDPALVDVNIHPSKLEVRFSEEQDVRDAVTRAIQAALMTGLYIPDLSEKESPVDELLQLRERPHDDAYLSKQLAISDADGVDRMSYSASHHVQDSDAGGYESQSREGEFRQTRQVYTRVQSASSSPSTPLGAELAEALTRTPAREQTVSQEPVDDLQDRARLRPIAQALTMYVVAEDDEAVYLIDQHAAHERILYERFMKMAGAGTTQEQELLVPLTYSLTPAAFLRVMERITDAKRMGLVYEPFGEHDLVVRAVPLWWQGIPLDRMVQETIDTFLEDEGADQKTWEKRVILRACKAAIKANQRLSMMEMQALLDELSTLQNPFTCPHGRPTALRIGRDRLEKEFRRR